MNPQITPARPGGVGTGQHVCPARLRHRLAAIAREGDQAEVREALRLVESALRHVSEAIAVAWLDEAGQNARIVYVNPAFTRMTGYEEGEVLGRGFEILLGQRSDPFLPTRLYRALAERRSFCAETAAYRRDGSEFPAECVATGIVGFGSRTTHVVAVLRDVTERRHADEVVRKSDHDPLTRLPNRSLFIKRLNRAIERAERVPDFCFAVLFLDLDRFKVVNDTLGHLAGDRLLVAAAGAIETCLRPGDTVARLGGDEFAVLLEGIVTVADATAVASRILERLSVPSDLTGHEVFTGASIGIAFSETGYRLPEDALRDADAAMYRAKALGRSRYEVFDTALHDRAVAVLRLETELRRAAKRDEFRVYYQPIVHLDTGRMAGFEALARWVHPQRGVVEPGEFVGAAEETGLIGEIDRYVLGEACRQLHAWQGMQPGTPGLAAHVNLSARTLASPSFLPDLEHILARTGLAPSALRIELSEGALSGRGSATPEVLLRLGDLGVQVCIDDFSTGYSSLTALQHSPIRVLKIDRFFVIRMGLQPDNREFVGTIIALALNLGLEVIAEGVESAFQRTQLLALKCPYGQGELFSKPVPPEEAAGLLGGGYAK